MIPVDYETIKQIVEKLEQGDSNGALEDARTVLKAAKITNVERQEKIIQIITQITGVSLSAMMRKTRFAAISDARALLLLSLIEIAGANRKEIARLLGTSAEQIGVFRNALNKKLRRRPEFREKATHVKEQIYDRSGLGSDGAKEQVIADPAANPFEAPDSKATRRELRNDRL